MGIQIYSFIKFGLFFQGPREHFSFYFLLYTYHFQRNFCCNIHITKREKKKSAIGLIGAQKM